VRFKFILSVIFLMNSPSIVAKSKGCKDRIEDAVNEMRDWAKYGINRDPRGVVSFPTKCTPFMKARGMIPLEKRQAAGVNRVRYLGNDCNIYEWDSQHGAFEVYTPNSSASTFYHKGEASVIGGTTNSKIDSKRDHNYSKTGLSEMDMKSLCKAHKENKLPSKTLDKLTKFGIPCNS
jgi:hypothetical protein